MLLNSCHELDDLGGGRFCHTANLRPIAYRQGGSLARIVSDFQNGDANYPHIVSAAGFFSYITPQGDWRVHPTRDPNVWFSIGAPFINPANPTRVSLNPFTRSGSVLASVNANVDVRIVHAGHFLKLEMPIKNGYVPPSRVVAFPISAQGVTRQGANLLVDGQVVMSLTPAIVYDAANRDDVRAVTTTFQQVAGNNYIVCTLPVYTDMAQPVFDPTLTLQPDAAAGKDTMIYRWDETNWGIAANFTIGDSAAYRGLFQFDVSSIPSTATITSATLTLTCTSVVNTNADNVSIHRILVSWAEGSRNGVAPSAGEDGATATYRNNNGHIAWNTSWGGAGTDYATTPTATTSVTNVGNYTWDGLADVAAWVSGTANNGWWFEQAAGQWNGWSSSDHATAANRPQLVIIYTLPGGGLFNPAFTAPFRRVF